MKKERVVLCIISFVELILGLSIYLFFNRNADISKIIFPMVPVVNVSESFVIEMIRSYGADLLWASAFTLVIQAILALRRSRVWLLLLCSILGIIFEFLQFVGVAKGTADILDVFIYLVGCAFGILIILGGRFYEKE